MAERRDFDDIKLIAGAEEPLKIGGIKPEDLRDLESDLLGSVDLKSPDLSEDLLDDLGELSAGAARPKKRRRSSLGFLMTLLMLIVFGGGAGYAYLNKDLLMPMVNDLIGGPAPIKPSPGDLPEVTTGPALPATSMDAPVGQGAVVPVVDPVVPVVGGVNPALPVVPSVADDTTVSPSGAAVAVPVVPPVVGTEPPPMDVGFTDGLPQPESVVNPGAPKDLIASVASSSVGSKSSGSALSDSRSTSDAAAITGSGSVTVDPVVQNLTDEGGKTPKDSKPMTSPESETVNPEDLDDLLMPALPDVQKSMGGKDEFIESKNTLDDLSDMRTPGLNLSAEQKAAGLGISVDESKKPSTKSKATTSSLSTSSPVSGVTTAEQGKGKQLPSATGPMTDAMTGMDSDRGTTSAMTPEVAVTGDIEGRIAAANRALDLERFQAAYDMFSELYKINPRDERVLMGRAVSLQKLGRIDEAITAYDDLLAIVPDNPDVMVNALGLVRQKNPTDALVRLMELRSKYPTNATIAAQIGLVNAELKNYDEGLKYLNIAADLESTNPKHFFNMAVVAERMGRLDFAIDYYERTLKADALSANNNHKIDRDMIYDRLSYLRQGQATP